MSSCAGQAVCSRAMARSYVGSRPTRLRKIIHALHTFTTLAHPHPNPEAMIAITGLVAQEQQGLSPGALKGISKLDCLSSQNFLAILCNDTVVRVLGLNTLRSRMPTLSMGPYLH